MVPSRPVEPPGAVPGDPGRLWLDRARLWDPEAPGPDPVDGGLVLEGGRIARRLLPGEPGPGDAQRLDLGGRGLAPGFLDLHLHADLVFRRGDALRDAIHDAGREMLRHGVTAFLPTSVAWPRESLQGWVTDAAAAVASGSAAGGAEPLGMHLEGPWIRPEAAGAQPEPGIRPHDPQESRDLLARGEGLIRMVTLAPEIAGARELVELLAARGVVAAAGHTLADDASLDAACGAGLTHVTHLFNAMGPMAQRLPGVAARALVEDRLSCDLICDGAHVHPAWVGVAARAKGERLVLITDRIEPGPAGPGQEDFGSGGLHHDGRAWHLSDGRLAGSRLTLDRALRNARDFGALSFAEAVAACSLRPARVLGIEAERGTLREGARADLVVLDEEGGVEETWIGGRRVWSRADA